MIPCKENKCLKYPICITKAYIECKALAEYAKQFRYTEPLISSEKAAVHTYIKKDLPKLLNMRWFYNDTLQTK